MLKEEHSRHKTIIKINISPRNTPGSCHKFDMRNTLYVNLVMLVFFVCLFVCCAHAASQQKKRKGG